MNLKNSFEDALQKVKKSCDVYTTLTKGGSKDPMDFHNMSYFAGVYNGMKFVWHVLDNDVTEKEFKQLLWSLLQTEGREN